MLRPVVVFSACFLMVATSACSSSDTAASNSSKAAAPRADAPTPSAGCATGTALRTGSQEITVTSGGLSRVSDVFVPDRKPSSPPAPLIIDFHAFAPRSIEKAFSGLTVKRPDGTVPAERAGAIVLTPLGIAAGTTPAWNTADYAGWADDDQFTIDLLDHVERTACIDRRRVYLTGFAIGGQMAAVVACGHADRITAFAAVSGLFDPAGCEPSRAMPVLAFHGTADPMIPYTGGVGPNVPKLGLDAATIAGEAGMVARLAPIPTVIDTWVRRDACKGTAARSTPAAAVTLQRWTNCGGGASIEVYIFDGGGHAWPQSPGTTALASLLGPTPTSLNGTDLMLGFFARQRLPAPS